MPDIWKKVLIVCGSVLLLLLLIALVIAAVFQKSIGRKVLSEVNKQLKTELIVSDFDLSLIRGFPDASAELVGVTLKDTRKGDLLHADRIAFRFGLFSLFRSKVRVRKIIVENGTLRIHIDKKGNNNYDIVKSGDEADQGSEDFSMALDQAILKNVSLAYRNDKSRQKMSTKFENAVFSGDFSSKRFLLESMAKLKTDYLDLDGTRYFVDKNMAYLAKIMVGLKESYYELEKLEVSIEKNVFSVSGFVDPEPKETDIDLRIHTTKDANIESLIQLLPETYTKALGDFRSRGQFSFEATVKGRYSDRGSPAIHAKASLKNGRINSPRLNDDLHDVSFSARFSNGKAQSAASSVFEIPDFKGYFDRELLEMGLRIENTEDPKVSFTFDGALPLASVHGLFNLPNVSGGSGEIELKNIRIAGRYKDMINPNAIQRVDARGNVGFDDASLTINKERILFDQGALELEDNRLKVSDLKITGAGNDIQLQGEFSNVLPILLADSLNSQNAMLEFDAQLIAPAMDFDRLLSLSAKTTEEAIKKSDLNKDSLLTAQTRDRNQLARLLKGKFEANVDAFNYDDIRGDAFKGTFTFENNRLLIRGEASAMEGSFDLDGTLFFEKAPYLNARIECNEINIKEFFEQTRNFGQTVIRSDHLEGSLTARLFIEAFWDEKGDFLNDQLHALGAISIENGELINLEMLRSFSTFVHIEDLRHIKFVDMVNWLEVKNQKVFIPVMFIRSNALNLTLNGEHGFDSKIDYNFKINVGQALLNFLKPHNPNLEPQKAEKKGWFNLYYNMRGTTSAYKVIQKRTTVRQAFEKSDRHKREIQRILTKEFGSIDLIDEPEDWQDQGTPTFTPSTGNKPDEDEFIDW